MRAIIIEDALVGMLYTPDDVKKRPGILLISGSDGGIPGANAIPESFIAYLVENGFVVLAIAYFGALPLPPRLENIPLEYFASAIKWLKSRIEVDSTRIGIIGQSRGAELALLLGCYFPHLFQTIVASAPCNMVCGGFPFPNRPAWTYQSKPILPYLSGLTNSDHDLSEAEDITVAMARGLIARHENTAEDPCIIADLFAARQCKLEAQKSEIPTEKLQCPILLLSGDQDAIWPSHLFCEKLMSRSTFSKKHINYVNAGHGILSAYDGPIYHPTGKFWCILGGTPEGNKAANASSWIDIKEFLVEKL